MLRELTKICSEAMNDNCSYDVPCSEELPDGVTPNKLNFAMALLSRISGDIVIFSDKNSGLLVEDGDAKWYLTNKGVLASHRVKVSWIYKHGGWYAKGIS